MFPQFNYHGCQNQSISGPYHDEIFVCLAMIVLSPNKNMIDGIEPNKIKLGGRRIRCPLSYLLVEPQIQYQLVFVGWPLTTPTVLPKTLTQHSKRPHVLVDSELKFITGESPISVGSPPRGFWTAVCSNPTLVSSKKTGGKDQNLTGLHPNHSRSNLQVHPNQSNNSKKLEIEKHPNYFIPIFGDFSLSFGFPHELGLQALQGVHRKLGDDLSR